MATGNLSFDLNKYKEYIAKSCLFKGIPEDKYINVLTCLSARIEEYKADASVISAGDKKFRAGILLDGKMEEYIYDENSNQVAIRHLSEGNVLGAELVCGSSLSSPVYLTAVTDTKVLLLDFKILLSELTITCPHRMQITANHLSEFANQISFFNTKLRILSQKKLRDKIKVYLQTLEISKENIIQLPCSRGKLAKLLNVDRSALSRELCRMRDEEILSFNGAKLKIIDMGFLA